MLTTSKAKNILTEIDKQISLNQNIKNIYVKSDQFAILANHIYKNRNQKSLVKDTLCYRGFSIVKN
jgi:hypothetical protein